jgi:hypothetical protein
MDSYSHCGIHIIKATVLQFLKTRSCVRLSNYLRNPLSILTTQVGNHHRSLTPDPAATVVKRMMPLLG